MLSRHDIWAVGVGGWHCTTTASAGRAPRPAPPKTLDVFGMTTNDVRAGTTKRFTRNGAAWSPVVVSPTMSNPLASRAAAQGLIAGRRGRSQRRDGLEARAISASGSEPGRARHRVGQPLIVTEQGEALNCQLEGVDSPGNIWGVASWDDGTRYTPGRMSSSTSRRRGVMAQQYSGIAGNVPVITIPDDNDIAGRRNRVDRAFRPDLGFDAPRPEQGKNSTPIHQRIRVALHRCGQGRDDVRSAVDPEHQGVRPAVVRRRVRLSDNFTVLDLDVARSIRLTVITGISRLGQRRGGFQARRAKPARRATGVSGCRSVLATSVASART